MRLHAATWSMKEAVWSSLREAPRKSMRILVIMRIVFVLVRQIYDKKVLKIPNMGAYCTLYGLLSPFSGHVAPQKVFLSPIIMERDKRYDTVKKLLLKGQIDSFSEMADIVTPTKIRTDLGLSYKSIKARIANPENFTMKEVLLLAQLIGCHPRLVTDLIYKVLEHQKKIQP